MYIIPTALLRNVWIAGRHSYSLKSYLVKFSGKGCSFFFFFLSSKATLITFLLTAALLAQSVERVDCRAGGRGFDSWGRTNTQGLKITEK